MVAKRDRGRQTARGLGEATRVGEKGVRRGCVCVCACVRERKTERDNGSWRDEKRSGDSTGEGQNPLVVSRAP